MTNAFMEAGGKLQQNTLLSNLVIRVTVSKLILLVLHTRHFQYFEITPLIEHGSVT